MPVTSNIEKLLDVVGDNINNINSEAIENLAQRMETSETIKYCAYYIAAHKDFSKHYDSICESVENAEKKGLNVQLDPDRQNALLFAALRSDVDYRLLDESLHAVANGVSADNIAFALNYASAHNETEKAGSILRCMSYGLVDHDRFFGLDTKQTKACADVCTDIDIFINNRHKKVLENHVSRQSWEDPKHKAEFKSDWKDAIYYNLLKNNCFSDSLSAEQIRASWVCFRASMEENLLPPGNANSFMDKVLPGIEAIQQHNTYPDMYMNIVDIVNSDFYSNENTDISSEQLWKSAKASEIESLEQGSDPFSAEIDLCKKLGFSEDEIETITDHLGYLLGLNNLSIDGENCFCDMLIEGIKPEDAFDYLGNMNEQNLETLDTLYKCLNTYGFSKELTEACLFGNLSSIQINEVHIGQQNGLTETELISMCDSDKSAVEMCQERRTMQKAHEQEQEHVAEKPGVMADKAPEAKRKGHTIEDKINILKGDQNKSTPDTPDETKNMSDKKKHNNSTPGGRN